MKVCGLIVLLCHLVLVVPLTAQEGIVAGVKDLIDQIQDQTRGRGLRVAVADFKDLEGSPVRLGQYLAEEMTTQIMRRGQVRVVERRLLGKVAEELRLNVSDLGLIDPASAQHLGRVLGVDALIVGTLTPLQKTVRIHVRLIGTETAEVVAGASTLLLDADELQGGMEKVPVPPVKAPPPASPPAAPDPPPKPILPAGNLLVNGDFAQAWDVGWRRQIGDLQKGENAVEVVNHPNAGRVVHLRHVGESHMAIYQVIPVENTSLRFEASFQAKAWEGPIWGFSGTGTAAVRLIYEDREGKTLGETNILKTVKNVFADTPLMGVPQPPRSSNREHQIYIDERWYEGFRLDIAREIRDYLPGVNPEQVTQIAVVLMVAGNGGDRCGSELWADNLKLAYNL